MNYHMHIFKFELESKNLEYTFITEVHRTEKEHFKQTLAACVIVSKCEVFKHSWVQQFVTAKIQFVSLLEI